MTEFRAGALFLTAMTVAMVAIRVVLPAIGADDQQIAAGWGLCLAIGGAIGAFFITRYGSSDNHR